MKPRATTLRLALLGSCLFGWFPGVLTAEEEMTTIHRVRAGDTVARICWQYKVRDEFIRAANPGLTEPLTPGERLVIPLGPGPGTPADPPAPDTVAVAVARPAARPILPAARPAPPILVVKAVAVPTPPPPPTVEPRETDIPALVESGRVRDAPAPPPPPPPEIHRDDFGSAARDLAARGLRYNERWTPPGEREAWVMDCSNTSRYLYREVAGVDIGRTASDQYYFLRLKKRAWDVPTGWDHLPRIDYLRKHLEPGDLLFWENTYKPVRSPDITHVMVYLGEDADGRWKMAGSQESAGVNIYRFDPLATKGGYSSWFGLVHHEGRFVAFGRPVGARL
jgi:hypothetical protein